MNQITRREKLSIAGAAVVASLAVIVAANASRPVTVPKAPPARMTYAEKVARGKYLVTIGGCHDCHTPWIIQPNGQPGPDMSRALSGHPMQEKITTPADIRTPGYTVASAPTNTAFSGPWGVSFTANLTPEPLTGTGIWTFEIFKNTIRNGRHWGVGRPILPPMPWFNYREMTDEDLGAVFAYLRTVKPVYNEVPQPLPPPAQQIASK